MIPVIGLASGIGGSQSSSGKGPLLLQEKWNSEIDWKKMILPSLEDLTKAQEIAALNKQLAVEVYQSVREKPFTMVIGGDHSCGIGTWSGVATALFEKDEEMGLIWLDAHMDCHTMDTSPSGNIHGMPVASLLGCGCPTLAQILSQKAKVKPENLFLVGIRSFESAEFELTQKLGIRVYYIEEVLEKGLTAILSDILSLFKKREIPYGVSLDIDFFDPQEMSASGSTVENGPHPNEFIDSCILFEEHPPVAFEYVEFNPPYDIDNKSLNWSVQILQRMLETTKVAK